MNRSPAGKGPLCIRACASADFSVFESAVRISRALNSFFGWKVRIIVTNESSLNYEELCLPRSSFIAVDLSASTFEDVDLRAATFNDVALTGATFRNACLCGVAVEDANTNGMKIIGVLVSDLFRAYNQLKPTA